MIKEIYFIVFSLILFCSGCTSPDEKSMKTWNKRVDEHQAQSNQATSDSLDLKNKVEFSKD